MKMFKEPLDLPVLLFQSHEMMHVVMYRYNSLSAYGQSKLANVLHANELARRLKVLVDEKFFVS